MSLGDGISSLASVLAGIVTLNVCVCIPVRSPHASLIALFKWTVTVTVTVTEALVLCPCSCHEHTTNLATGVSRQPVIDCGTIWTAAAGTFLRFLQTIFENTSLWRLKCLVTLSTYRRYINKCIYLSTRRLRAHHRVNPYPFAPRQNETKILSDNDKKNC